MRDEGASVLVGALAAEAVKLLEAAMHQAGIISSDLTHRVI